MEEVNEDGRFAHISKDPRFHKMRREERKVKIDKRFRGMMKDSNFKLKYSVDPRGRPVRATTNENLRKFYDLSDSDISSSDSEQDSGDDDDDGEGKIKDETGVDEKMSVDIKAKDSQNIGNKVSPPVDECPVKSEEDQTKDITRSESDSSNEDEEDDSSEDESSEAGSVDYARGEGAASSSSEEDDDLSDSPSEDDQGEFDHGWAEHDHSAPRVSESSRRLALCNMDWDRVKARDLMVLLNSFKPPGGIIQSVAIYPSEFGKERMKEEDVSGPQELRDSTAQRKQTSKKGSSQEGEEYHMEKLRQYQLNRLRYYYAVVECDSVATADHLYEQCDGTEYESSATRIDLRFIPDDMEFEDKPTSVVSDLPEVVTYKPSLFANTALQQSKVSLTWDETERDRLAFTGNKLSAEELEKLDVKDYLASDSDEYDVDPYAGLEDPDFGPPAGEMETSPEDSGQVETADIEKYRSLVKGIRATEKEKEAELKDMEMEIKWEPGLKETTEELVKKKKKVGQLTPWEEYQEKRKEKQKKKREEKKKKKEEGSDQEDQEVSAADEYSDDDDLPAGIDLNDPYFKEELDKMPAKPAEKKGTSKKSNKNKNKKRRDEEGDGEDEKDEGLSLLVMDEVEDNKAHFSLRAIQEAEQGGKKKRKRLRKKKDAEKVTQDTFTVDVEDARFGELFSNPHYNIDPTAPEFKKTRAMESLIEEKHRRRQGKGGGNKKHEGVRVETADADDLSGPPSKKKTKIGASDGAASTKDYSLVNLVKSVKAKTQTFQNKKVKKR